MQNVLRYLLTWNKAREWALSGTDRPAPANVYVVIRVYNLEKRIALGFKAFVDLWSLYLKRELNLFVRGDYAVTSARDQIDLT